MRSSSGPGRSAVFWAFPLVLLPVLILAACSKVNEQPELPAPPPPPPAPAPAAKKVVRTPRAWPASTPPPAAARPADPAGPAVDTLNGDPDGLKREQLQAALDGAMGRLTACFDGVTGTTNVALSFDADPSGKAENVKVSGGGASGDRCVSATLASLSLPKFSGKPVPVHFPLTIQRTVTQPAPAPPTAAAQAPANPPPVFVRP